MPGAYHSSIVSPGAPEACGLLLSPLRAGASSSRSSRPSSAATAPPAGASSSASRPSSAPAAEGGAPSPGEPGGGGADAAAEPGDAVDEAIELFRVNLLFKSFEPANAADRSLVLLLLALQAGVKRLDARRAATRADAARELAALAAAPPLLPGDAGWPLGGLLPPPRAPADADAARAWLRDARRLAYERLLARLFPPGAEGAPPNKHWMAYAKRKFMGKELPG